MGIRPTRAETGYGYIEAGAARSDGSPQVVRFTEKPDLEDATKFVAAGNFYWNSGMFVWGARTLADALREYLPNTCLHPRTNRRSYGTARLRRNVCRPLSQVREHQHRLRAAGAALQERRGQVRHLLHSGNVWLERSRLLDRALRASCRQPLRPAQRNFRERKVRAGLPRATSYTPRNSLPWSECTISSSSKPKMRCSSPLATRHRMSARL